MNNVGEQIAGLVTAIVGVAIVALIVSYNAATTSVISAFFGGLSNLVGVAISPVTGQSVSGLSAAGLTGGSWIGLGASNLSSMGGAVNVATQGFGLSIPSSLISQAGSGAGSLFGGGSSLFGGGGGFDTGSFDSLA